LSHEKDKKKKKKNAALIITPIFVVKLVVIYLDPWTKLHRKFLWNTTGDMM